MEITKYSEGMTRHVTNKSNLKMFELDGKAGRTALIDEREYLFFSGYDYLGIGNNSFFEKLVVKGIQQYGWLYPSSRISNSRLSIYEKMERHLSDLTQTRDTVLFPSGFLAGRAVTQLFAHRCKAFTAPATHPAIAVFGRTFLGSFGQWSEMVMQSLSGSDIFQLPVLIADSVQPLSAAINDFTFLQHIDRKVICIIDDSHGVGLIGKNGEGISSLLPRKENIDYIITYSLSKAFHIEGGAVSCTNAKHAEMLRTLPDFTATTSMPPALIHAFLNGAEIYEEQRNKLKRNIQHFDQIVPDHAVAASHAQLPIFVLSDVNDENLSKHHIIISSFPYPDPRGKKIKRVVLNALHTQDDLQTLADALLESL